MTEEAKQTEPMVHQQPVVDQQPAAQPAVPSYRVVSGTEEWQNDIFDCFQPSDLCLKATFCPCFVFGKTQTRLRDPSMATYERVNNDCLVWAGLQFCCGVGVVYQFLKRKEMRQQYAIKGDDLSDFLFSCCCHCCALIQQEKEVIGKQQQVSVNQQGYVAPTENMSTGVVEKTV